MWGTDLTSTLTGEGEAAIFVTVDHCSTECIGIHAVRRATRFEALEPIRQGVRACFGAFDLTPRQGLGWLTPLRALLMERGKDVRIRFAQSRCASPWNPPRPTCSNGPRPL